MRSIISQCDLPSTSSWQDKLGWGCMNLGSTLRWGWRSQCCSLNVPPLVWGFP